MIRVLLVEDVVLLRSALVAAISREPDVAVVTSVGSAELTQVTTVRAQADVAVIDLDTRRNTGLAALRAVAEHAPYCCILVLTRVVARGALRQALQTRVAGFLGRDCEVGQLIDAIRRVAAGERFIEPGIAVAALSAARCPLTARELEVLRLAADGQAPVEIASSLFLTAGTVRNYLSSIMRKLGARSRYEAVTKAQDANWL